MQKAYACCLRQPLVLFRVRKRRLHATGGDYLQQDGGLAMMAVKDKRGTGAVPKQIRLGLLPGYVAGFCKAGTVLLADCAQRVLQ
ncbi:MAG: hypothetical protein ACRC6I_18365 [Paracoccaceae bacterium]